MKIPPPAQGGGLLLELQGITVTSSPSFVFFGIEGPLLTKGDQEKATGKDDLADISIDWTTLRPTR